MTEIVKLTNMDSRDFRIHEHLSRVSDILLLTYSIKDREILMNHLVSSMNQWLADHANHPNLRLPGMSPFRLGVADAGPVGRAAPELLSLRCEGDEPRIRAAEDKRRRKRARARNR
jgi:hypothetical protein